MQFSKLRSDISVNAAGRVAESGLLLAIAGLLAVAGLDGGMRTSTVIAVASIGLTLLFLCFYYIEVGVYALFAFGFLVAFIERMIPMTVSLDSVLMALPFVLFGTLLIRNIYDRRDKLVVGHPIIFVYMITVGYIMVQAFNPSMGSF